MSRRDRIRAKHKIRRIRKKRMHRIRSWAGGMGRGLLSLAVLGSLTLLGFSLYQYFERHAPLPVGEIKVSGCIHATEAELLNLLKMDFKTSLVNLDLKEVSSRLTQHPWVEKAKIKRDLSRKSLMIEVQERIPQALILLEDLYLVDRQGEIFKKAESKERLDLPVFTGLKQKEVRGHDPQSEGLLRQALELLSHLEQRKVFRSKDVSEIHLSKQKGLTIFTLKGGIPIHVGLGGFEEKLNRLEKVLPDLQHKSKDVLSLDLNYDKKVIVKLKEPEKEKSRRS